VARALLPVRVEFPRGTQTKNTRIGLNGHNPEAFSQVKVGVFAEVCADIVDELPIHAVSSVKNKK